MARKIILRILTVVLLLVLIIQPSAAGAYDQWELGNWVVKNIEGENVICAPENNVHSSIITKETSDKNQIKLTAKIASSTATIDGNFGVLFKCANGTYYFFEYNIVYNILRLRRLGTDSSDLHLADTISFSVPIGEWFDYEITVGNQNLKWYINGELKYDVNINTDELSQWQFCCSGILLYSICGKILN